MIFQDENAIPASVSRPARVNVFDQTPAKTPARAPLSVQKPRAFEVFPEEDQAQEEQPAESVLPPRANIFSTPAYKPAARRIIVSNAITEEEDEGEGDQYVPLNNDGQADDQENVGYGYGTEEGQNPISKYKNYLSFMTPISERTNEHTQMTNLRSSQSTNVFSVSSGRRSSVRSVYQDGEDLVAEDLPPSNLSAVQEEEERSASRPSESFDESVGFPRNEDDVSFPQQLEESGSDAARFVLPEGFTIHNRPAENQHHSMVVTDARPDTPREASPEPELEAEPEPEAESDTAAFVTANHGMLEVMTTTATLPNPCIPTDDEVLATLIRDIKPPLSELPNFLDLRNTTSNRLASLNSHTKVKPRRSSAAPRPSVSADDCVGITLGDREFEVSNKIGEGGFGAVFLAVDVRLRQQMDDADSDDEDEDDEVDRSLVAVKVEKPGSVWEAVILDRILTRLDPVHRPSIIRPRELISFADESYLVLDYAPQGTLLDAVNKASTMGIAPATAGGPSALDELVAIFFTIELLRLIESLHRSQFIHGDMKIDNCLVRLEDIPSSEGGASSWSTQYSPLGSNGWQHKGIKLIDFGRAIDMSLFPAGEKQKFKADWKVDERDCVEMREDREWSYETDYFGLASICYCMLFGKYITTEEGVTPEGKSVKWYKITTPLKRVCPFYRHWHEERC
jgi:checkpoint serine/threonine-protein kinase